MRRGQPQRLSQLQRRILRDIADYCAQNGIDGISQRALRAVMQERMPKHLDSARVISRVLYADFGIPATRGRGDGAADACNFDNSVVRSLRNLARKGLVEIIQVPRYPGSSFSDLFTRKGYRLTAQGRILLRDLLQTSQ
jgi:hypothetical protein